MALVTATGSASAATEPSPEVRFWILPFDSSADPDLAEASKAVPELLTVFFSRPPRYAVVEREHLDRILAEEAMGADGLASPSSRQRVGELLEATTLITGSVARDRGSLLLTAHATDIRSGRVQASVQVRGTLDRLVETVHELQKQLVEELRAHLPKLDEWANDADPVQSLHFLRGLSYYYAADYHRALAEFIQCDSDRDLDELAGLWRANCYLAGDEYEHAFLELVQLQRGRPSVVSSSSLARKIERCLDHLSEEQQLLYEKLSAPAGDGSSP